MVKCHVSEGGELDLKSKGTIIAVSAVVLALFVSAGIAIAAGVSGGGVGRADSEMRPGAGHVAGDGLSYGRGNAGEKDCIRAENRVGAENGACEGDCEQERLRERDCDGECDGGCDNEGTQSRSGWSDEPEENGMGAGARNGGCAGDCERIQDRLCDGTCDGECDGDGSQSQAQTRNGR